MAKQAKNKPELLAGVGSFTSATAAVKNGADAVYFGVKGYNMRDLGTNFSLSEIKELMSYLHENKVKGYLALNTIIFEGELKKAEKVLSTAKKAKVDAVIASDLGVISLVKKLGLTLHISTQASVGNVLSLEAYKKLGAKRIVLARELSLKQIKELSKKAKKLKVDLECFVHGAMCIAVSGRCFLSHELFGRSANRGKCLQVCRRAYFLDGHPPNYEKKEMQLQGSTILSAKDLKTIQFLDKIIGAGVTSVKIEGRTKPAHYIATVTKCYRKAINSVSEKTFTKNKISKWNEELSKVYNRGFSDGFYFSKPGKDDLAERQGSRQTERKVCVGQVKKFFAKISVAEVKLSKDVKVGDSLLVEGTTTYLKQLLEEMQINHKKVLKGKKGSFVAIKVNERVREKDQVFVLNAKNRF